MNKENMNKENKLARAFDRTARLPFTANKKHREKKIKIAITLLNEMVKVKLAPSPIHGIGVFALRDIKKGGKLYLDAIPHAFDVPFKDFKKLDPEISEILLGHWPQIVNGSHFLYPVTKFSAYCNHSDTPNVDMKEDKALRKIKKGEELTENYKLIEGGEKVWAGLDIKK